MAQTLTVRITMEPEGHFLRADLEGHTLVGHVASCLPLLLFRLQQKVMEGVGLSGPPAWLGGDLEDWNQLWRRNEAIFGEVQGEAEP